MDPESNSSANPVAQEVAATAEEVSPLLKQEFTPAQASSIHAHFVDQMSNTEQEGPLRAAVNTLVARLTEAPTNW